MGDESSHLNTEQRCYSSAPHRRETQHCDTADIAVVANSEFHSRGEIKLVES